LRSSIAVRNEIVVAPPARSIRDSAARCGNHATTFIASTLIFAGKVSKLEAARVAVITAPKPASTARSQASRNLWCQTTPACAVLTCYRYRDVTRSVRSAGGSPVTVLKDRKASSARRSGHRNAGVWASQDWMLALVDSPMQSRTYEGMPVTLDAASANAQRRRFPTVATLWRPFIVLIQR
jgi:hypothetical protein